MNPLVYFWIVFFVSLILLLPVTAIIEKKLKDR